MSSSTSPPLIFASSAGLLLRQEWDGPATVTIAPPPGATSCTINLIGPGGGGGSGTRGAAGFARYGGGGGGSGGRTQETFALEDLKMLLGVGAIADIRFAIAIGDGGNGGASPSANNQIGSSGTASLIDTLVVLTNAPGSIVSNPLGTATSTLIRAGRASGGGGGIFSGTSVGGAGGLGKFPGVAGGVGTDNLGGVPTTNPSGPAAGCGGSGINASNQKFGVATLPSAPSQSLSYGNIGNLYSNPVGSHDSHAHGIFGVPGAASRGGGSDSPIFTAYGSGGDGYRGSGGSGGAATENGSSYIYTGGKGGAGYVAIEWY